MKEKQWDAESYQEHFSFVPRYGQDVLGLLKVMDGMSVLDLGCGNGALTAELAGMGADVTGVDASEEMVRLARKNYPHIRFIRQDAVCLQKLDEKFDAVFSNAVFHWIWDQEGLLRSVSNVLKAGGQLVCEFGGHGCGAAVHCALQNEFEKRGLTYHMPFYFPTIGEYAPLMEKHGLRVVYATLFDRPTKVEGEHGVSEWIRMFVTQPFEGIPEEVKEEIIMAAEEDLCPKLRKEDGWYIDYVRIRIRAVKELEK